MISTKTKWEKKSEIHWLNGYAFSNTQKQTHACDFLGDREMEKQYEYLLTSSRMCTYTNI